MYAPRSLLLLPILLLCCALAACGGGSGGSSSAILPATDFWVDAQTGNDADPGTQALPFKTLTHALAAAGPGSTLQVMPGLYDAANGETFPLQLQAGQQVIGDVPSRGLGQGGTTIAGEGMSAYNVEGTVLMADGARLAGLEIRSTAHPFFHHAVHVHTVTATVEQNTFGGSTYGGVWAFDPMGSTIADNDFHTNSYGVYGQFVPGPLLVQGNTFHTPVIPLTSLGATSDFVIDGNTFIGSGQNAILVQNGDPVISGNLFDNPSGYTYGAISALGPSAAPRVRGNTFLCVLAVRTTDGAPDLGTANDPGNNDFSGVTGTCVEHNGTGVVNAIGNTWPHVPPTSGGDIVVPNGGTVVWGTGPGEQY